MQHPSAGPRSRPGARHKAALLVLAALAVLLPAVYAAPASAAPARLQATAPQVQLDGAGGARFTYSVSASTRTTVRALRLRVRPVTAGAPSKDTGPLRQLDLDRSRDLASAQTGLAGTYRARVAWTLDGTTWSTGPATTFAVPAPSPVLFGTLQSSPARLDATTAAGVDLATFDVSWKRFEPVRGRVDSVYLAELKGALAQYRAAGVRLVLNTGVHHPPAWLLAQPHSRYVNQYGDAYASTESGKKIANMVFNERMRAAQAAYLQLLATSLGSDFWGVRLGGGWYGELNYPDHTYNGRTNAYWGFDAIATGKAAGLPAGMTRNPVPQWVPGTPSLDHEPARRFLGWYLESLRNYHDWQIQTARKHFGGKLLMLYPSWGVRPGQLDEAVGADLAGTTSAERNGEVQRGFDVARFIAGITDPGVVVYTTWLNADASADGGTDQRYWSPVKYLASQAARRAVPLQVMGENTGRDTVADMALTFDQAERYGLGAVVWAFEPELFGGVYASIGDYATAIRAARAG